MGILEDFHERRNKRQAVPFRGFASEEDLYRALESQKYVIMTGQNPAKAQQKGPFGGPAKEEPMSERNEQALRSVMKDLDDKGLYYTTQVGNWGEPEFSLIVWANPGVDEDEFFMYMHDLAEQYGQEAFVASEPGSRAVVYTDPNQLPDPLGDVETDAGVGNVTPVGNKRMTGLPESMIQFDEEKPYPSGSAKGTLSWTFQPKDWKELTPEQQEKVKSFMQKRKAGVLQREKRRSNR